MKTNTNLQANLMLILTAVIWGGGFVAQRVAMQDMPPFFFNGIRFTLGSIFLIPVLYWKKEKIVPGNIKTSRLVIVGGIAGVLIFLGATFQQLGLVYTPAGKAGFITGLYVVIVPLLGTLAGQRSRWNTWAGAILAVVGLYLLSVKGNFQVVRGDILVLIGAFFWAGHVHYVGQPSTRIGPIRLSFVQFAVTALLSFGVGIIREEMTWIMVRNAAWVMFYAGVISVGIAYTLQIVAQQEAKPDHAAIILSMEAVFAVVGGWLFLGEVLSTRGLMGCLLMLAGMLLSQIDIKNDLT
jgi:drug/metabolite transporter (DMT)-like permease